MFHQALERLRKKVDPNHRDKFYEHPEYATVLRRDLDELLRDYDRLDDMARTAHRERQQQQERIDW